jgi:DNA-binding response OmpR family regulator
MGVSTATHATLDESQSNPTAKVLLVDEDCEDLESNCSILEKQGYEVRACTSLVEGIHCLDDEPFDFVVVCQGSHRFEGRYVLERAIEIDRHRPVVVLTRSHDMSCYLEAMQLGAVDYFEKPMSPLDVARVLRTHSRVQRHAA